MVDTSVGASLLALSPHELAVGMGGTGKARDVWRVLRRGGDPFRARDLTIKTQRFLQSHAGQGALELKEQSVASCGTRKLLLELIDGLMVETVLIPNRGRLTVCVSSQVGCARGCGFCLTATMGLKRSLDAGEIVAQVWWAFSLARRHNLGTPTNIVFMGMGEPLDNLKAVAQSQKVLSDPWGFGFGPNRITLSTVGPSPKAILDAHALELKWAWSLHAVDDALRRRLIPTARHSVADLRDAFRKILRPPRDLLFVEMTMLRGVNDSPAQADSLAVFLEPLRPNVRINLLPMNPGRSTFEPSTKEALEKFKEILSQRGYRCLDRRARGSDHNAACGQLVQQINAPQP
jgi:23S rRNA (adenine2503-C2)-methyltransferase